MRSFPLILQITVILALTACGNSHEAILAEVESVKQHWCPDSSVAIFNVDVRLKSNKVLLTGETTIKEAKTDLIKRLLALELDIVDSIIVFPDQQQKWAITSVSVANHRDRPEHAAQLVSQTIMGTPLQVLKVQDGWSLVQSPDQYIAWVNNSSMKRMNDTDFSKWKNSKRGIVMNDCWLLNDAGERVSDLVKGSIIQVDKLSENAHVLLPDGRNGVVDTKKIMLFADWVSGIHLRKDALVEQSKMFMGLPYLWGGTSSKAVDCSGFMKNIYFMSGYILARDASQQINYGHRVELKIDSLHIGDLLFFGNKNKGKVTHVAMYIGNAEYIHSSGRVKINSLDKTKDNYSAYRTVSWMGAQRYIGQQPGEGLMPVSEHNWYVNSNQ